MIGRDSECDIALDDAAASRRHAQVLVTADGVWIEDLGSQNGVVVVGQPGPRLARLVPGDSFTIGRTVFALDFSSGRPSMPPPAAAPPPPAPASASTQVLHIEPTFAQYVEGRLALHEDGRPLVERFVAAIGVVQQLGEAGALGNARTLLGDALDTLVATRASAILAPLTVVTVRRLLSQLASHFGDDPEWRGRMDALGRAEQR